MLGNMTTASSGARTKGLREKKIELGFCRDKR